MRAALAGVVAVAMSSLGWFGPAFVRASERSSGTPSAPPGSAFQQAAASSSDSPLDYEFFKTKVQPIFLAKRPGHARCIACHASGTPLRLQPVPAGAAAWNDEQSRKNFEAVRRVVVPGSVTKSRLLMHPLAENAGGDFYHNGGKHWNSQSDPEWQTLKTFVMGPAATRERRRVAIDDMDERGVRR